MLPACQTIDQSHCYPQYQKFLNGSFINHLYDYFNNNNLLAGQQYVFRAHHSTDVKLVDYINIQMDNGKIPVNIYLDLSKAFDTLDFKILLKKLEYYGIIGSAYNLLENYQVKREQYVNLRIIIQSKLKQNQESLKGPFLAHYCFVSTLNDLVLASAKVNYIMYANDTTLYITFIRFSIP